MDRSSREEFIEAVCAQVRFTPARKQIAAELRAHLEDRAAMLEERGFPPGDAAARAAASMGDPAEIGAALDKEHSSFWGWTAELAGVFIGLVIALFLLFGWLGIFFLQEDFDGAFLYRYSTSGMDHYLSMYDEEDTICKGRTLALLETEEYWAVVTGVGLCVPTPALQTDCFVIYKNPFVHEHPRYSGCVRVEGVEGEDGPLDSWALVQAYELWREGEGPMPDIPEELTLTLVSDLAKSVTITVPMTWRNGG